MKALFYIIVLVAIMIACWQLAKMLGLTSQDKPASPTYKENNINGYLMLGLLIFIYGLMIKSIYSGFVVLLPESASVEGMNYDKLMAITMILLFIVQFITQFLIFYFSFKYRGLKNTKAYFYADSNKLETIWTVVPAVVLTGLIIYGLWTWNMVMDASTAKDPLIIEVYAKQFQWQARYAGKDNTLGFGNVRFIKGINTMGVDMADKNSLDDIPTRVLHLPKGRKVVFKFRSQDVIHSAYMPHFRAQMNCVPGMVTQFAFTPSLTTKEMRANKATIAKVKEINALRKKEGKDPYQFDYLLLCNKICGSGHYNMQMKIIVESQADFNRWLASQKTLAQIIK